MLPDLFQLQVHKEPHTSYIVTQFLFLYLFVHSINVFLLINMTICVIMMVNIMHVTTVCVIIMVTSIIYVTAVCVIIIVIMIYITTVTNSRAKPPKPHRWKSMLIHQGWFTALRYIPNTYSIHKVSSLKFAYFQGRLSRHITSPSEKTRPESWPGDYMGEATLVWQLSLSHRCHQM